MKQMPLHVDRQFMPQPICEAFALPGQGQAKRRGYDSSEHEEAGGSHQRAARHIDGPTLQRIQPAYVIGA